jgi:hypothetical protein
VEFVQDYVQFHFDGPTLTAITWPRVHVAQRSIDWDQPGFRDTVCGRIGKLVRRAYAIPSREIVVEFDDNSSVSISTDAKDARAAEAAVLDSPPNSMESWP